MNLKTNVKEVTGVGEKRAQKFAKLNITNVNELIYHLPRAYQHRGNVLSLADAEDGTVGAFILTVGSDPKTTMIKNRMSLTKFMAFDDTRRCQITYFNQDYIKNSFIFGNTYRFWGKVTVRGGMCMMSAPQFEPYIEGIPLPEFIPLYPLTEGITQKIMANSIQHAVKRIIAEDELPEMLTENIRSKYNLCDIRYAIEAIHAPLNYDMLNRARERLAFDELFTFALGITLTKTKIKKVKALPVKRVDLKKFYSLLPFKPTNAQLRTNDEILADMCGEAPMSRLVSGDVGSGKTVCAAAAVYIACKNGYQSAFMVPTEILAQQHYHDLKPMFESVGIRCALLIGSLKPTEKRRIHDYLQTGVIDLVIGTHALISAGVEFMNLGLVITDEQHRFGVMQRSALAERGENPHVLVMSATPIPRTLALILYGDLSISVIDEMPPGRQKVDTFIVDEDYRTRLNAFIRKQVEEGRQVYIVCPAVDPVEQKEEDEGNVVAFDYGYDADKISKGDLPIKSAVEFAAELQENVFPDLVIGFIHGKMKGAEKESIMRRFADNEIQILVSTTVIEVGVNVPNATLMIVENAERFGLSQLHQLRGRVGRGKHKSYCILVSESKNAVSLERLNVMKATSNGYKIAEKDLELRGPGDFFPSQSGEARQHGGYKFKVASMIDDMTIMMNAVEAAHAVIANDPALELPEHQPMLDAVMHVFEVNERTFN